MERTLAIIKPGAGRNWLPLIQQIICHREERGDFRIRCVCAVRFQRHEAESFYGAHRGKEFFESLIGHTISAASFAYVLEGENVVAKWRELMKPIRQLFANEGPDNAVHGSDSAEAAEREIALLFSSPSILVQP